MKISVEKYEIGKPPTGTDIPRGMSLTRLKRKTDTAKISSDSKREVTFTGFGFINSYPGIILPKSRALR
jgi:hypothetical protein